MSRMSRGPLWAVLAWAGMFTLRNCLYSISSADHAVAHLPLAIVKVAVKVHFSNDDNAQSVAIKAGWDVGLSNWHDIQISCVRGQAHETDEQI